MLITSVQSFKLIARKLWEELITQICYPILKPNLKNPQQVHKISKRSIKNCGRSWLHKLYTVKRDKQTGANHNAPWLLSWGGGGGGGGHKILHFLVFLPSLLRWTIFLTFCLLPWTKHPFQNGSALIEKNLLQWEQILLFKNWLSLKREAKKKKAKLLSIKVYIFALWRNWTLPGKFIFPNRNLSLISCSWGTEFLLQQANAFIYE